jgi:hypothetical protein
MLREPPSCVLGLDWVHVQANVVIPREIMYGGFVRWYRKHLGEGFVVNVRTCTRKSKQNSVSGTSLEERNSLFVTDGPPALMRSYPQEDYVVRLEMHRESASSS